MDHLKPQGKALTSQFGTDSIPPKEVNNFYTESILTVVLGHLIYPNVELEPLQTLHKSIYIERISNLVLKLF